MLNCRPPVITQATQTSPRVSSAIPGRYIFLRPHTYRFGAGRSALREQCLQTVFSAQQRCHLDNFRYFDVFSDNFVISLVFPLYFLCNSLLTVSDTKQSKHKGKTRDMTKLSPKTSKYRKLTKNSTRKLFYTVELYAQRFWSRSAQ